MTSTHNAPENLPLSPDLAAIEDTVRTTAQGITPRQAFRDALDAQVRHAMESTSAPLFDGDTVSTRLLSVVGNARGERDTDLFMGNGERIGREPELRRHPRALGRRQFVIGSAVAAVATAFMAARGRREASLATIATEQAQHVVVSPQVVAAAPPNTAAEVIAFQPDNLDFSQGLMWWQLWGDNPSGYTISFDPLVKQGGSGSSSLASIAPDASGFGTLARTTAAGSYRGTRVRMTGVVKAESVGDWAGLWMRVDGAGDKVLSFDNMQGRPITGTHDWQEYAIVLDVPQDSTAISFGVLLSGAGHVWLNAVRFNVVGPEEGTTDAQTLLEQMRNLDFASGTMGWFLTGSQPRDYRIASDAAVHEEKASASLRSVGETHGGFGTLMQMVRPTGFVGTRVRMTAWVKAENVADWAGLWMRVDGADRGTSGQSLRFDNMQKRPITGTRDWQQYEIVLDVPANASAIAFGILLQGTGAVWLNDVVFMLVGTAIPTTA